MLSSDHRTLPNNHTFPSLLSSCAKLLGPELGRQVHCHVTKFGLDSDAHVRNSLIALYSGFGHLDTACKLFDEFTQWDVVSFNVMIGGYNKGGRPADGLRAFADMVNLGVKPDRCTFACLMSVCSALGDLRSGKVVHVLALKNVGVYEFGDRLKIALVDMYVKLGAVRMADRVFSAMGANKSSAAWIRMVSGYAKAGEVEIARRLFDEMPEKDLISWTSMISGYSRIGRYKEALDLYEEMEKEGIKPHEVTLIPVLSACARLGRLDLGKRLHRYVEDAVVSHNDSRLCTVIVDMYAKCGCIGTALEIFDRVDKKTTSLFNSMISGLAQHGLGERAVALLEGMEALGLRPDKVTFVAVLCACSHSGLIEEGKKIFDSMVQKYGIHPQLEHYGCMVDLLGRRGYVDEAYDFIKNMPITPNFVIWSALLRNCRVHENARIGEIAERKLLQLGSNDSGSEGRCSRLVEMFLDTKSPQNAKKLRKMMNYKPVWKQQGWSYIEWNGSLHQFLADDVSHPQSKEIHLMLEEMMRRLRSAGLDVVSRHSERLALAFGLINLGPGETLRIVTDLRMCSDCHSSFKLLSKVFSREIAVRDKIRFHHMKNGSCSCLDSW
nr:pentatricopeptide repeat protein AaPPR753 [Agave angustifolia]